MIFRAKILLIVLAIGLLAWALFYFFKSSRRGTGRGRTFGKPRQPMRASDQRALSPLQLKAQIQARELSAKGQFTQAAALLEQVGMQREAINILEDAKLYDDAVAVLMRLQRPGRAGVLYSRNGLWGKAAPFFVQAGQMRDAARAYREAGEFNDAARIFVSESMFADAADCFMKSGQFAEAARAWTQANTTEKALDAWNRFGLIASPEQISSVGHADITMISGAIANRSSDRGLIQILAGSSEAAPALIMLLKQKNLETVRLLLNRCSAKVIATVVSSADLTAKDGKPFAELLMAAGHSAHAGTLFERYQLFEEASKAYEAAGDRERAGYCLKRLPTHSSAPASSPVMPVASRPTGPKGIVHSQFVIESAHEGVEFKPHWFLHNVPRDAAAQMASKLKTTHLKSGGTIDTGTQSSRVVYLVSGNLKLGPSTCSPGDWPGIEDSLTLSPPQTWMADGPATVAIMTDDEFNDLCYKNGILAKCLYTNLTLRLKSLDHKPLISKAI